MSIKLKPSRQGNMSTIVQGNRVKNKKKKNHTQTQPQTSLDFRRRYYTSPPDLESCEGSLEGYPIPWRLLGNTTKTTLETAPTTGGSTVKDTDMISTPPIKSFSRELQAADHAANNEDQTAYKASKESTAL
jgi:hypothetical protein